MCYRPDADSDDDSDDDFEEVLEPMLYDQGLYFAADIITIDKVYRLTVVRAMDVDHLCQLYKTECLSALQQQFRVPQLTLEKSCVNRTRVSNRNRNTMDVTYLQDEGVPRPSLNLGLAVQGVNLRPVMRPRGPDVELYPDIIEISDDDDNIDEIVDRIWRQFPADILAKAPNRKSSAADSYVHLNLRGRETATVDMFKTFDLSPIFSEVRARAVPSSFWGDTLFHRFFPPQSVQAKPVGKLQNFPYMKYYRDWIGIAKRLNRAHFQLVVMSLKPKFMELYWLPLAQTDRLWCTRVMRGSDWHVYPNSACGKPCPQIAINPRFSHKGPVSVGASAQEDRVVMREEEEESSEGEYQS
jgi:hypothetical protein